METGVQIAERQILAVLRDQRFLALGALNQATTPGDGEFRGRHRIGFGIESKKKRPDSHTVSGLSDL